MAQRRPRFLSTAQLGALLVSLASMGACVGSIGDAGDGDGTSAASNPMSIPARVRRLTKREYDATLAALFDGTAGPEVTFPTDSLFNGYENKADALRVTSVLAQNLWAQAPELSVQASAKILASPPCTPSGSAETACARQIIEAFASRAYRRPLAADELAELMDVFSTGRTGGDFREGLELALRVIFQSAGLLYHTELGPDGAGDDAVTLTPQETAEELAYLLTGGPPDPELMAAASKNELSTPDGRERHARRLLSSAGAREALGDFAKQWLELSGLESLAKDAGAFPEWSALQPFAAAEPETFFASAVLDERAKLSTIFTANWTVVDDPSLATFYGVAPATAGRITLPPARSGVLTSAAVMAAHAKVVESSPIQRGHFVRVRLFCQPMPPPPATLVITPPSPDPNKTTRERFAEHSSNPTCARCHERMDPLGFAFENFDGIGRFRAEENSRPIDASGSLTGTDVDGSFKDAVELGRLLSESRDARACFARHWLEYSTGRNLDSGAAVTLEEGAASFLSGESSIQDLIIDLVRSDLFVTRTKTNP